MEIYIIRHGKTEYNKEHRLQGQLNTELADEGRKQAKAVGEKLREMGFSFDAVYSSPLKRAVDTAELVSGCSPEEIILDDHIIEIDFGPLEGRVWEDLSEEEQGYVVSPWKFPHIQGVEPMENLIVRADAFLQNLRKTFLEYGYPNDKKILLATHGMMMHGLLVALSNGDKGAWNNKVANCHMYRAIMNENEFTEPELFLIP